MSHPRLNRPSINRTSHHAQDGRSPPMPRQARPRIRTDCRSRYRSPPRLSPDAQRMHGQCQPLRHWRCRDATQLCHIQRAPHVSGVSDWEWRVSGMSPGFQPGTTLQLPCSHHSQDEMHGVWVWGFFWAPTLPAFRKGPLPLAKKKKKKCARNDLRSCEKRIRG